MIEIFWFMYILFGLGIGRGYFILSKDNGFERVSWSILSGVTWPFVAGGCFSLAIFKYLGDTK